MTPAEFREAREAAGLSQEQLAELLGTNQTMVSRMERHQADIPAGMRAQMRRAIEAHEASRRERLAGVGLVAA